jgi:2-polyprenyl-3-methyl-5-hydroxy-6-metoxy-1,4-benzoquinol methylase
MTCDAKLRILAEDCRTAKSEFDARFGGVIEGYREAITVAVQSFVSDLRDMASRVGGHNLVCDNLAERAGEYLDWLQWTFWDLPYFASALRLPIDRLREGVKSCGMAYLSLRIVDDVVDRHFTYKGRHESLLSLFEKDRLGNQRAEGLTILAGLLVCFTGLRQLAGNANPSHVRMLDRCLEALQQCTIGAIAELSPREVWNEEYYERLIRLKNVAFWEALYVGIDPEDASPLLPFLRGYYALAQKLNDVGDFPEDERRSQPNLLSVHLAKQPVNGSGTGSRSPFIPAGAEEAIAVDFVELSRIANGLPDPEQLIARLKLGESLEQAFRIGLFGGEPPEPVPSARPLLGLEWYSTLNDVLGKLGPEALVETGCAVCKSASRKHLFEKQGFHYHRCTGCGHVYVSPRINGSDAYRMGLELDQRDYDTELLEVQKFYAAPICYLLRARAPGHRLIDLGFGKGYLLQLAKSYGFEVYGTDTSPSQVERLRPQFGDRLHQVTMEDTALPWTGFDAVVISHVLDHLEKPDEFIGNVFRAMNPDGVLYVAVPDLESVQFQLFGKKWEAISPLAHFQYFQESTLTRLLKDSLFIDIERVEHEPVREEVVPRWMRLLRKLGATDTGELAVVCRRPTL